MSARPRFTSQAIGLLGHVTSIAIALVVLAPVLVLWLDALHLDPAFAPSPFSLGLTWFDPWTRGAWVRSLALAATLSALSVCIGVLVAEWLHQRSAWLGACAHIMAWPGTVPPIVTALGLRWLCDASLVQTDLDESTRNWLLLGWTHLVWSIPLTVACLLPARRLLGTGWSEIGHVAGGMRGRWRAWRVALFPQWLPHIRTAAAITYFLTLFEVGAPLALGQTRLLAVSALLDAWRAPGNARSASLALAALLTGWVLIAILFRRPARLGIPPSPNGDRATRPRRRAAMLVRDSLILVALTVFAWTPLAGLVFAVWRTCSPGSWAGVADSILGQIANRDGAVWTFAIAAAIAYALMTLMLASSFARRSRATLELAVPCLVMGLGAVSLSQRIAWPGSGCVVFLLTFLPPCLAVCAAHLRRGRSPETTDTFDRWRALGLSTAVSVWKTWIIPIAPRLFAAILAASVFIACDTSGALALSASDVPRTWGHELAESLRFGATARALSMQAAWLAFVTLAASAFRIYSGWFGAPPRP